MKNKSITKRFNPISVCHRNHHTDTHCKFIHGYGRVLEIEITCDKLDENGWVFNFGGFKNIRKFLESEWDHKTIVSVQDPELDSLLELSRKGVIDLNLVQDEFVSLEGQCEYMYNAFFEFISPEDIEERGVRIKRITIFEHSNNRADFIVG